MILGGYCDRTTLIDQDHETEGTPPEPLPRPQPSVLVLRDRPGGGPAPQHVQGLTPLGRL